MQFYKTIRISTLLSIFVLLGACSSASKLSPFPGVYRIDVQQGNVITQDMVDELRPGMTKRQVEFVLGTPLVADTFNPDRWDYVYSYQPGGKKRQQQSLTVYFKNDALSHFEGNFRPSSAQ